MSPSQSRLLCLHWNTSLRFLFFLRAVPIAVASVKPSCSWGQLYLYDLNTSIRSFPSSQKWLGFPRGRKDLSRSVRGQAVPRWQPCILGVLQLWPEHICIRTNWCRNVHTSTAHRSAICRDLSNVCKRWCLHILHWVRISFFHLMNAHVLLGISMTQLLYRILCCWFLYNEGGLLHDDR